MSNNAYKWDENSAIRERLYLLTRIGNSDPSEWRYNPHRDEWSDGQRRIRVGLEGSASLDILANRGLSRKAAMDLIGYPEK
jgi:hypothetical protein